MEPQLLEVQGLALSYNYGTQHMMCVLQHVPKSLGGFHIEVDGSYMVTFVK